MIRSLKTLGLALVAVLALSAVVASAASAAPKLTPANGEYPVTLKGEQTKNNILSLEGGRKVECATATFEGEIKSEAEAKESKVTVSPTYSNCTATILGNVDTATITLNGCTYTLTNTETASGTIAAEGWEYTGKETHLTCPPEKLIEIHVYSSMANHEADIPLCTYHIAPQTPAGSLDYKLTEKVGEAGTSGDIGITLTGVAVTKTSGTVTNCGNATQTGGLTGEVKVEGFNSKGEMIRGIFDME